MVVMGISLTCQLGLTLLLIQTVVPSDSRGHCPGILTRGNETWAAAFKNVASRSVSRAGCGTGQSWSLLQRDRAVQRTDAQLNSNKLNVLVSPVDGVFASIASRSSHFREVSAEFVDIGSDPEGFRRSCLRACFGELADKTFFLVVALTVWCPWTGVRDHDDATRVRCLVFIGTLLALAARIVMSTTLVHAFRWATVCVYSSLGLMGLLALLAYRDMCRIEAFLLSQKVRGSDPTSPATERYDVPEVGWNEAAFARASPSISFTRTSGPDPAPTHSPRRDTTQTPRQYQYNEADGVLAERISDRTASCIISFILPLIGAFIVEAEDKSEATIFLGKPLSAAQATGAMLGQLLAVVFALVIGVILERRLTERWAVFLIVTIFFGLTLVELSQSLLHMPPAQAIGSEVRDS